MPCCACTVKKSERYDQHASAERPDAAAQGQLLLEGPPMHQLVIDEDLVEVSEVMILE